MGEITTIGKIMRAIIDKNVMTVTDLVIGKMIRSPKIGKFCLIHTALAA